MYEVQNNKLVNHILFHCESLTNVRLRYFNQLFIQPHELREVSLKILEGFSEVLGFLRE